MNKKNTAEGVEQALYCIQIEVEKIVMAQHKQMMDIKPFKGISRSLSNEYLRRFSEGALKRKAAGNFDPTREHLDFEVTKGGKITPVNKSKSIPDRIKENLAARGIVDPNEKLIKAGREPRYRTVASFVLGGNRDVMRGLAFGDQKVDFDKDNNPDNSWVKRQKGIEEWAVGAYNFMCKKYGEENIAAFVVHLDEKNPHVHCSVLPIKDNKFSWVKTMSIDGKNNINSLRELRYKMHDEFAEVNAKYGLERGERHSKAKHREYDEYLRDENNKKKSENDNLDEQITNKKETVKTLDEQIKTLRKEIRSLNTMIEHLQVVRKDLTDEIDNLTEQKNSMIGDTSRIDARLSELKKKLDETDKKIFDKRKKLNEAKESYDNLMLKTSDARQNLQKLAEREFSLSETLERLKHDIKQEGAENNIEKDMREIGYKVATYDADVRFKNFSDYMQSWTLGQKAFFNREIAPLLNQTQFGTIIQKGDDLVQTAVQLYLNLIEPDTYSNGGGGGGGSSSGLRWDGRNEGEDDTDFKIRCYMTSIAAHQNGINFKKKSERKYGRSR